MKKTQNYIETSTNFRYLLSNQIIELHNYIKEYNYEKCNGIYDKARSSFDLEKLILQHVNLNYYSNLSDDDASNDSVDSYN